MKPKETLLHLFHFICGGFLEQKATEYECLLMWKIEVMLDLPVLTSCSWHVYKMASKWKRAFSRIPKELDLSPLANTRFRGSRVLWNRESACSMLTQAWCLASHPRNKGVRVYYLQGYHANWPPSIRLRSSICCVDSHRRCKVKEKQQELTTCKLKFAKKEKIERENYDGVYKISSRKMMSSKILKKAWGTTL